MSWEIGWRCSGELRPCSFGSSAVPTLDRDEDGGVVLRYGNSGDVGRSLFFLPLPSFFLSWLGCAVDGHQMAAGRWENSRALGVAL